MEELKNLQFERMLKPAQERLRKYSIEELCCKSGLQFDDQSSAFTVKCIGKNMHIHYPEFTISLDSPTETIDGWIREPEMWLYLTLLQYLDTADGTPMSETTITLQQMRGGISRGRGYEHHIDTMYAKTLSQIKTSQFETACRALDAEFLFGKADVTAKIYFAPRFPVIVNFWEGDEEFPASVKTLLNGSAEHYLTIEAAGGVCLSVVEAIHREIFSQNTLL